MSFVIIDGDNFSPHYVPQIERELTLRKIPLPIRRDVFVSKTNDTKSWSDNFTKTVVNNYKNAVDFHITVKAMELSGTCHQRWFVLCSSDSDYIPLIQGLRRQGHRVLVMSSSRRISQALKDSADIHVNIANEVCKRQLIQLNIPYDPAVIAAFKTTCVI